MTAQNDNDANYIAQVMASPTDVLSMENPSIAVQVAAIRAYPAMITMFERASEEVQLACIEEEPACYGLIRFPTKAVTLAAYARRWALIKENRNPNREEQLAAVGCNASALYYITEPCRDALLLGLQERGAYLYDIRAQQALGRLQSATTGPVANDIELQYAALSNITGALTYAKHPELFDKSGLEAYCPGLCGLVESLISIGCGPADEASVKKILAEHKAPRVASLATVDLPDVLVR